MTTKPHDLQLAFEPSAQYIPATLTPLLAQIINCYQEHHSNLRAVYVVGSTALGDFIPGMSDIDIIGVTDSPVSEKADLARRGDLTKLSNQWQEITFVDNAAISRQELEAAKRTPPAELQIFRLSTSAVRVWGKPGTYESMRPSVEELAYNRTWRAAGYMANYRAGIIMEAFRQEPRRHIKSCGKSAMRVLSSITILRGAPLHMSLERTAEAVEQYVPEAAHIKDKAMAIIKNPTVPLEQAMAIADEAIALFYQLNPDAPHKVITNAANQFLPTAT
ncbi:MAG TPA: nucleotidyltransferase domain-containing protein, partial [Candidatus Saccharimonadales bacterium]|nr:nucleotidyltransferase domain-containing protein [Candidatus Saccharimonadales bacterium]